MRAAIGAVAAGALLALALAAGAAPGPATNDEIALLVLANQARSEPSAFGYSSPVVPPMIWNDGLAAAARAHSDDMGAHGCFQHDSCNGESWSRRITRYYSGWSWLGENIIGVVNTPELMHAGWMGSAGHRANILSGAFTEFGGGIGTGRNNFGEIGLGTEDFGSRGLIALNALPAIPAGAVLPRIGSGEPRKLLVNYFHHNGGRPDAVRALVGDSCIPLALVTGRVDHGTYGVTRAVSGSGCVPLVFEAIRSDGRRARFPETGAILVGIGAAGSNCAERTVAVPSADCGDPGPDPAPSPTPAPTPDPGSTGGTDADLRDTRLVLRGGAAPAGRARSQSQIALQAVLPPDPAFAPASSEVVIDVVNAAGERWSKVLPKDCSAGPCLRRTNRGRGYRSRYDAKGTGLSLMRAEGGGWRLRFWSTGDAPRAVPGVLDVTLSIGGYSGEATLNARAVKRAIVAE
ncbi:MAG TPA: CAP domain-containing protein [Candidatus Binatia bacterium]|nr:CAP domain-containing protein [Candidatus Binatia bacterium]